MASQWQNVAVSLLDQTMFLKQQNSFVFKKLSKKTKVGECGNPHAFSRSSGQMLTHVQDVEIGNGGHLEKIWSLKDSRQNMEKEKNRHSPGYPWKARRGRPRHFLQAAPAGTRSGPTYSGLLGRQQKHRRSHRVPPRGTGTAEGLLGGWTGNTCAYQRLGRGRSNRSTWPRWRREGRMSGRLGFPCPWRGEGARRPVRGSMAPDRPPK